MTSSSSSSRDTEVYVPLVSATYVDVHDVLRYLKYYDIASFVKVNRLCGEDLNYVESIDDLKELTISPIVELSKLEALYEQIMMWKRQGIAKSLLASVKERNAKEAVAASAAAMGTANRTTPSSRCSTSIVVDLCDPSSTTTNDTTTNNTNNSTNTSSSSSDNNRNTSQSNTNNVSNKNVDFELKASDVHHFLKVVLPQQLAVHAADVDLLSEVVHLQMKFKTFSAILLQHEIPQSMLTVFTLLKQQHHHDLHDAQPLELIVTFDELCLQSLLLICRSGYCNPNIFVTNACFPSFFEAFFSFIPQLTLTTSCLQFVHYLDNVPSLERLLKMRCLRYVQEVLQCHPQNETVLGLVWDLLHNYLQHKELFPTLGNSGIIFANVFLHILLGYEDNVKMLSLLCKDLNQLLYCDAGFNQAMMMQIMHSENGTYPLRSTSTTASYQQKMSATLLHLVKKYSFNVKLLPLLLTSFSGFLAMKDYLRDWLHQGGFEMLLQLGNANRAQLGMSKAMVHIVTNITSWYTELTHEQYQQLCQWWLFSIQEHISNVLVLIELLPCVRHVSTQEAFVAEYLARQGSSTILPLFGHHFGNATFIMVACHTWIQLSTSKEIQVELWQLKAYELCLEIMHAYGEDIAILGLVCTLFLQIAESQPNIHDFGNIGGWEVLLKLIQQHFHRADAIKAIEDMLHLLDDLSESPLFATLLVKCDAFAILRSISMKSAFTLEIACSIMSNLIEKTGIIEQYCKLRGNDHNKKELFKQLPIPSISKIQAQALVNGLQKYKGDNSCLVEVCRYVKHLQDIEKCRLTLNDVSLVLALLDILKVQSASYEVCSTVVPLFAQCALDEIRGPLRDKKCIKYVIRVLRIHGVQHPTIAGECLQFLTRLVLLAEQAILLEIPPAVTITNNSAKGDAAVKTPMGQKLINCFIAILDHILQTEPNVVYLQVIQRIGMFLDTFKRSSWMHVFCAQDGLKRFLNLLPLYQHYPDVLIAILSAITLQDSVRVAAAGNDALWITAGAVKQIFAMLPHHPTNTSVLLPALQILQSYLEINNTMSKQILQETPTAFQVLILLRRAIPIEAFDVAKVLDRIIVLCCEEGDEELRPFKMRRLT